MIIEKMLKLMLIINIFFRIIIIVNEFYNLFSMKNFITITNKKYFNYLLFK